LQRLGCSLGQGFLFGRPVPAADFPVPAAKPRSARSSRS
jgi:EAL domain-containing protein (putative c-di-GMP-specific phosphodiesterase class I)